MKTAASLKNDLTQIKNMDFHIQKKSLSAFIETIQDDERKSVRKICDSAERMIQSISDEEARLDKMMAFERQYESYQYVGGIDEAGRGPLAGPVVAACVILNKEEPIPFVNDSKKLSAKKREELYEAIIERSVSYGIGIVSEKEIDKINILESTYKAMRLAIDQMEIQPGALLNDAVIIPGVVLPQEKIIKGDAKSLSIAAASILAKVTRDRIMEAYDELYPEYGFKSNKGYGSKSHIDQIKAIGASPIHRQSFIKNFL